MDFPLLTSFSARLKWAREAAKLTQPELARACGWENQSRMSHYETGRNVPAPSDVRALAAALNQAGVAVTPGWLLFGKTGDDAINVDPAPEAYRLPMVSWVRAGLRDEAHNPWAPGMADDWIEFDSRGSVRSFCLKVRGDSMQKPDGSGFPDGCIIAVDPMRKPRGGDFVVVRFADTDEATFKQYIIDGPVKLLKPLNPSYPTFQVPPDAHLAGVVFEMRIVKKF